jgi:hypothetical protein
MKEGRGDVPSRRLQIPEIQQVVLFSKREEVCEEGVPVGFEREVEDKGEMSVVDVGKDTEELFEDMFGGRWEGRRVVVA